MTIGSKMHEKKTHLSADMSEGQMLAQIARCSADWLREGHDPALVSKTLSKRILPLRNGRFWRGPGRAEARARLTRAWEKFQAGEKQKKAA